MRFPRREQKFYVDLVNNVVNTKDPLVLKGFLKTLLGGLKAMLILHDTQIEQIITRLDTIVNLAEKEWDENSKSLSPEDAAFIRSIVELGLKRIKSNSALLQTFKEFAPQIRARYEQLTGRKAPKIGEDL